MQLSVALQAAVPAEPGGPAPLPTMSAEIDVELRSTHFQHQRRHLPLRVRPAAGGAQRLGAPSLVFNLSPTTSPFAPSTPPGGCISDDSGSLAFPRECAAQLAASELRFAAFGPRGEATSSDSDGGGDGGGGGAGSGTAYGSGQEVELLCKGSTTLADVPPTGQPLTMEVNLYSGISPAEDQLVGRLQVELKLSLPRRRGGSRSRSLGRACTATATEEAGEAALAPQGSSGSAMQSFGSGGVALTRSDSAPQPRGCGRSLLDSLKFWQRH